MRPLVIMLALVLLAAAPAGGATTRVPRLRLVSASPLVVSGARFAAHERVRVVARSTSGKPVTRRVRASRSGALQASFASLAVPSCGRLIVRATGSRGSLAHLTFASKGECTAR